MPSKPRPAPCLPDPAHLYWKAMRNSTRVRVEKLSAVVVRLSSGSTEAAALPPLVLPSMSKLLCASASASAITAVNSRRRSTASCSLWGRSSAPRWRVVGARRGLAWRSAGGVGVGWCAECRGSRCRLAWRSGIADCSGRRARQPACQQLVPLPLQVIDELLAACTASTLPRLSINNHCRSACAHPAKHPGSQPVHHQPPSWFKAHLSVPGRSRSSACMSPTSFSHSPRPRCTSADCGVGGADEGRGSGWGRWCWQPEGCTAVRMCAEAERQAHVHGDRHTCKRACPAAASVRPHYPPSWPAGARASPAPPAQSRGSRAGRRPAAGPAGTGQSVWGATPWQRLNYIPPARTATDCTSRKARATRQRQRRSSHLWAAATTAAHLAQQQVAGVWVAVHHARHQQLQAGASVQGRAAAQVCVSGACRLCAHGSACTATRVARHQQPQGAQQAIQLPDRAAPAHLPSPAPASTARPCARG